MNATTILKVIEGLGKSHEELVTKSIIPEGILEEPYDGCDHLTNSPEEGIELAFEKNTNRLDKVSFLLIRTVGSSVHMPAICRNLSQKKWIKQVCVLFSEYPRIQKSLLRCP